MQRIYNVNFYTIKPRQVFNRKFSTMEKAILFVASLEDVNNIDLSKIILHEEILDQELDFHIPDGKRDPFPDPIFLEVNNGWVSQKDKEGRFQCRMFCKDIRVQ